MDGRAASLALGLAIASLGLTPVGAAAGGAPAPSGPVSFGAETASPAARRVADWVARSGDNDAMPFVIVDKAAAKVFVFDAGAHPLGAARALLGLARGDDSVRGIGQRRLATIRPWERTTPAGRFVGALGRDFEQDVLWIDYDAALSLHRVITGAPTDHRRARLASAATVDKRISYGCINVPPRFYDQVVAPAFAGRSGVIYILPEVRPIDQVFPGLKAQPAKPPLGPGRS